jgi:hypothetical protein
MYSVARTHGWRLHRPGARFGPRRPQQPLPGADKKPGTSTKTTRFLLMGSSKSCMSLEGEQKLAWEKFEKAEKELAEYMTGMECDPGRCERLAQAIDQACGELIKNLTKSNL